MSEVALEAKVLDESGAIELVAYPAYKESGIAWLGAVPAHWPVKRLKFFVTCNDQVLPESTPPDYRIQYVEISGVTHDLGIDSVEEYDFDQAPSRARRRVKDGDTILSTVRTYLKAVASIQNPPENMIVSTGFAVIRPTQLVSGKFLSYLLQSDGFVNEVVSHSVGVSYPAINPSTFMSFSGCLPELYEQTAIASFLDQETACIDALIRKKQQLLDLLQEKRTALISQAVTKGLDPGVPMKGSGVEWLGEVPAHWEVSRIKFIVTTPVTDGPHETPEILSEGVLFVSAEAINSGKIEFSKVLGHISEEDHKRFSKKYCPKIGDIYMVKSGATTGRVAMVEDDRVFNIWSPLAAIRCNSQLVNRRFVYHYLQSKEFQTAVQLRWSFGTQQNIGMGVIQNLAVPLPSLNEQSEIATTIDNETVRLDAICSRVRVAVTKLVEYRLALISAVVTGKIDVRVVGG